MSTDKPDDKPEEDPKIILRKSLDDAFTMYVHDLYPEAYRQYSAIIATNPEKKSGSFQRHCSGEELSPAMDTSLMMLNKILATL